MWLLTFPWPWCFPAFLFHALFAAVPPGRTSVSAFLPSPSAGPVCPPPVLSVAPPRQLPLPTSPHVAAAFHPKTWPTLSQHTIKAEILYKCSKDLILALLVRLFSLLKLCIAKKTSCLDTMCFIINYKKLLKLCLTKFDTQLYKHYNFYLYVTLVSNEYIFSSSLPISISFSCFLSYRYSNIMTNSNKGVSSMRHAFDYYQHLLKAT